ncbi:hypothetical protein Ddye_010200 [Dipteronia dyeriana]|uniref:Reverse transcriptase domain-containing protein n=1 Tax=Dipteronia dyeriana TaxID=168575 RepID=A0AAE0CNL3_9ROSI|nr:hypothetical protein Ddye_010200 [Dipteronia dyeriana]
MSKAYDMVEWVFIEQMMRKLGFSKRWINLIILCVSFVSYSFMLNGAICGLINPSRGLRQWDPLSLYLFLLCAEGFSSLVSQMVDSREFQGFRCSRDEPTISHLFFTDDSMLFAQATVTNCVSIKHILDVYALALGQIINFDKPAMCVSPSIPSQECDQLAAIIGVGVVDCHEIYLGLPCFTRRKKKEIFVVITGRIWDKIRGWRDKFLSVGEKGGLGFRDLEIFNKALLANQCWRLMNNGNSLAACVLKACYFLNDNFIDVEVKSTASFIWKSLMWGKEIIAVDFRWRVGDGSNIRIYKDRWILRPSTFKPISLQSHLLAEDATMNQLLTLLGSWDVNLLNSIFREEDVTVILSIPIGRNWAPNSLQWHYDQKGCYSAKRGYWVGCSLRSDTGSTNSSFLSDISISWWKSLWKLLIPSKITIFVWKTCNNMIPCFTVLARRKIPINKRCPMCKCMPESVLHGLWGRSSLKLVHAFWSPQLAGFGIVIRDSEGFVMASSSQKIEASFSPQIAEATVILSGFQLALDTGLSPCRIDSNVEVIVNWINSGVGYFLRG